MTIPAQRLIYLVTEDWYFISHRLPMARAAQQAGFEVHVVTHVVNHGEAITTEGFILHSLDLGRGNINPISLLLKAQLVRALYRSLQPSAVHHVALQPSIVGSLAALGMPIAVINAVNGLGYAFTSATPQAWAARTVLTAMMRRLFNRRQSTVLVQNPDDKGALTALGVAPDRIVRIAGSGVDTERLTPSPEPTAPPVAAFVGRLLKDKGLQALLDAHALLTERGHPVRLLIAGEPDPANPASIPPALLEQWRKRPGVEFLGHVADIRALWASAHIAVLPSRREGLPLSLLEAAACGRPMVATDVPGCREIARDGVNAILVPVDDPEALASAIERLAADAALRARYGTASRELAATKFSTTTVGREIVTLYRRAIEKQPAREPTSGNALNEGPSS